MQTSASLPGHEKTRETYPRVGQKSSIYYHSALALVTEVLPLT